MPRLLSALGALSLFLSILLGAVGAHAVPEATHEQLIRPAVHYHQLMSVILLFVPLMNHTGFLGRRPLLISWAVLALGMLLFTGSLYIRGFLAPDFLPMIAPIGGTCMMLGCIILGLSLLLHPRSSQRE